MYVVNRFEVTEEWTRSILCASEPAESVKIEVQGDDLKEKERFGLVKPRITRKEGKLVLQTSIINWRNYLSFMTVKKSSMQFSNAKSIDAPDTDLNWDSGVFILEGKEGSGKGQWKQYFAWASTKYRARW